MPCIRSSFWRGGVCNALIFHRSDLPRDRSAWQPLFAAAMGSPDPYARQLNGMGGGVSSLSKVCVVSPSKRDDADIDFEFLQVVIEDGSLDVASNCGNMTAAVGPFALDQRLLSLSDAQRASSQAPRGAITVRIYNTNTNKIITSTFPVTGQPPRFQANGDYTMNGVPGTGSEITLTFLSPGGTQTGRTLPNQELTTKMDIVHPRSGAHVRASLVDVANPGVFVDGAALGIDPDITPGSLDGQKETMALLEGIRREAAERMHLNPDVASVPKIVAVFPPAQHDIAKGVNIRCIVLSMGQTHKAIPLTLALNLAAACRFEGTLVSDIARGLDQRREENAVVIRHPGGTIEVGVDLGDSGKSVESASISSTARLLMHGFVNVE